MFYTVKLVGHSQSIIVTAKAVVDGEVAHFSIYELLGAADLIPYLSSVGNRAVVDMVGDKVYPIVDPIGDSPSIDVTNLFSLQTEFPQFNNFEALASKLGLADLTAEDVKIIWKHFENFKNYTDEKIRFKIEVPSLLVQSSKASEYIKAYNDAQGHQFQHISAEINKTNFMRSPEDKLFIKIPEYSKLQNKELEISSLLPELKDIAEPYPHLIYSTIYGDAYLDANPTERKELATKYYSLLGERYKGDYIPTVEVDLVRGSPSNNATDILPNEEGYYKALEEFIKYDISQVFPNADVDQMFKEGNCSPRMMEYLNALIVLAYRLNWNHLNKMELRLEDISDDDDDNLEGDDSSTTDAINADNKLFIYHNELAIDEGMPRLRSYIDKVSRSGLGFQAHIEAIIKMFRWGDVKPTVLKLDGYNVTYFDLHTFRHAHSLGTLSSVVPVKYKDHDYQPLAFVLFDERFKDPDFRTKVGKPNLSKIDIPVGLVCIRHYAEGLMQLVAMSMLDIVTAYKENPGCRMIHGVEYVNGKFNFTENIDLEGEAYKLRQINTLISDNQASLQAVYFESYCLKELGLEYGFKGMSTLGILNTVLHGNNELSRWGDVLSFSNTEQLKAKLKDNPFPLDLYFSTNIALQLVPILLNASENFDKSPVFSLDGILNMYSDAATAGGYQNERSFLKAVVKEEKPQAETEPPSQVERMEAFGGEEETISLDSYPQNLQDELIEPLPEGVNVTSLVDGTSIVGGFTGRTSSKGVKYYLLVDPSEVPAKAPPSSNQCLIILPLLMETMKYVLQGTPEKSRLRFTGTKLFDHYFTVLRTIYKRDYEGKKVTSNASSK